MAALRQSRSAGGPQVGQYELHLALNVDLLHAHAAIFAGDLTMVLALTTMPISDEPATVLLVSVYNTNHLGLTTLLAKASPIGGRG